MKIYNPFFLFLTITFFSASLIAQTSGTITYAEVTKLQIEGIDGLDMVSDMLPTEMSSSKALYFDGTTTVYRDAEDHVNEDIEMTSDDGSFQLVMEMGSSTEEILFTDLKAKHSLQQTGFMGKEFLIVSELEKPKWKITNERIKYLGYVCQKAIMTETIPAAPGSDEADKEVDVVAWFTSEIPSSIGPRGYNQLPGAILMVSVDDGKTEIKATEVNLEKSIADMIIEPTTGQRVSHTEYEKIMAEKLKEMQEMHGGEGTFMIRG